MDMGIGGRGGARRRTRRRHRRMNNMAQTSQPQAAEPTATASGDESAVLLQKLADLHSAGILTDEELQAKKLSVVEKY